MSRRTEGGGLFGRPFQGRLARLVEDFFKDPWGGLEEWMPEMEMAEEDNSFLLRLELPGIDPKDVEVSITGDRLTIAGEKKEEQTERGENLYRSERRYGSFRRTIPLPPGVNPEQVTSDYSNGVLTLRFTKDEGREARRIPIGDGGKASAESRAARPKKLTDFMTKDVECAHPHESLREVARRMKDMDIGSFPVCDDQKKVVGMITDRDLAIRALAEGKDPSTTRVQDVMTQEIVTLTEDATIDEAERLMKEHKVRRLPVVDPLMKLVGYFTIGKVARTESSQDTKEVLKSVTEPPSAKAS